MLLRMWLLWVLVLLTSLWGAVMQIEMSGFVPQPGLFGSTVLPPDCHHAHAPVIGDLELAKDPACFANLIAMDWSASALVRIDRNTNLTLVTRNTQLDLAFIALYWLTFVSFAWLYWPSGGVGSPQSSNPILAKLLCSAVVLTASIAAIYDLREDALLFRAFPLVARGRLDFATPFLASRIKWIVFGLTTILVGLLPIRDTRRLRKLFAVLMLVSGVTITIGTLVYSNPAFGVIGLSLSLLLALFVYFPWKIPSNAIIVWLVSAYLLRFQIISAFLLAIMLPAGYFLAPSIFYGLFDAIAPFSFFLICFAALLLALIIMITSRLTLAYAPARFPDLSGTTLWMRPSWIPTIFFSLLASPMIVLTWAGTQDPRFLWWHRVVEVLLALGAAFLFLGITAMVHGFLEDPKGSFTVSLLYPPLPLLRPRGETPSAISLLAARIAALLPENLQAGILRTQDVDGKPVRVLRSGHRLAATAFFGTLVLYTGIGMVTAPRWWEHGPAAMFYVLFLLCLLTWFFAGIAFFLDRLRIPVLTAVIAASMVISLVGGTDHVYELATPPQPVKVLSPTDVIGRWAVHRADPGAPIVVVATAGGGIRAAAWTAQVLTGLTENCQVSGRNNFTSSVVLISSVSGGSEGAMYFAGWYDKDGNTDLAQSKSIRDEAGESDLGAVGWGLLYPDLLRTIPGSGILNLIWPRRQHIDRGWALEKQWIRHWSDHKTSPLLSEWNADVANGTRPAVIFNATVAESGERFVAATTELYEQKLDQYRGTVQFFRRFQGEDLPVSTAARLSATFPFVSPMARADTDRRHGDMHVGDGGYYDNSGLLSATQWLRSANMTLQDHQVILLIIDSTPTWAPLGEDWTWQRQTVAPLNTLLGVRTSSQKLRARYEQDLLEDLLVQELGNQPAPLVPVYFRFKESSTTPLSWHLRPDQLKQIGDQWNEQRESDDAKKVYDILHCPDQR